MLGCYEPDFEGSSHLSSCYSLEGQWETRVLSGGHADWALNATGTVILLSQASEEIDALWMLHLSVSLATMRTLIQGGV